MLLEFSCSNYKSIKGKIVFSMIASKDDANQDSIIAFDKYRVLRSAVIYGANGSGKSSIIEAISFVKQLVLTSINNQPGQGIFQIPHKMLGIEKDSSYEIHFVQNNIRFAFGFSINKSIVVHEYLYCFPNGRQTIVYKRELETVKPGNKYLNKFESCKDILKPNRLFLSCAANFSSVPVIENAFAFFRDNLIVYRGLGTDNWMNYSLNILNQNQQIKATVIEFLKKLGTGIEDIIITRSKKSLDPASLPPFLSDDFKAKLLSSQIDVFDTKIKYKKFSVNLNYESTGIKKLLEFVCPLVDILNNGKVLVCDEMEANFHESIVYGFVGLFRQSNLLTSPQLVFTTHDTSILDLTLFRRDQIWFTELTKDYRATDLYSLAEIKNVRKDENIGKGYIAGKYGAIPMLNSDLASFVAKGE